MNQHFYTSEELDHILAEIKIHQPRNILLRIDEILAALNKTSPAEIQRKAAFNSLQKTGSLSCPSTP